MGGFNGENLQCVYITLRFSLGRYFFKKSMRNNYTLIWDKIIHQKQEQL